MVKDKGAAQTTTTTTGAGAGADIAVMLAAVGFFFELKDAQADAVKRENAQVKGTPKLVLSDRIGGPLAGRTVYSSNNSLSRSKEALVVALAIFAPGTEYANPPAKKRGKRSAIEGL
jgi:hypothetical protein